MDKPDPRRAWFAFACGKKNEGKSEWCRRWWDTYPFDRIAIDVTGDLRADFDHDGEPYQLVDRDVIPVSFPHDLEGGRVTLVYVPDMGSATAADDMDRVVGLALDGKDHPVMLWVDEAGRLTTGNYTPPNTRRVLHHGRHHAITLLGAAPRPMDIDPLWINQADAVAAFRLPNPADRRRVADNIGVDWREFDRLNVSHCRDHAYMLYDQPGDVLYLCPPLPARRRGADLYEPVPS